VSEQNKPLTDRKPLEREPVFGEWLRGIYASERNPRRDGMYVETIRRTGRMNPGKAYRCTDGKGDFWEYPHDSVIFLAATRAPQEAAAEVEYAKSLAVSLWRNHYKETAPNWEPFDDLMGLLSQIDNMTCRLVLPAGPQEAAAAEGEARKIWESLPSGKSAKDVIQAYARALSQAERRGYERGITDHDETCLESTPESRAAAQGEATNPILWPVADLKRRYAYGMTHAQAMDALQDMFEHYDGMKAYYARALSQAASRGREEGREVFEAALEWYKAGERCNYTVGGPLPPDHIRTLNAAAYIEAGRKLREAARRALSTLHSETTNTNSPTGQKDR
jgi:hypothetical protein